jgi:hypothetical protein
MMPDAGFCPPGLGRLTTARAVVLAATCLLTATCDWGDVRMKLPSGCAVRVYELFPDDKPPPAASILERKERFTDLMGIDYPLDALLGSVPRSYDVLILGAGFGAGRLDQFRALAAGFAGSLLERHPFSDYRDVVNFYRMDTVGSSVISNCSDGVSCAAALPETAGGGEAIVGEPVESEGIAFPLGSAGFDAVQCWTDSSGVSDDCGSIWFDDESQAELLSLGFCAPSVDAIVVLVNSLQWAGWTAVDAGESGISLVAMGVLLRYDAAAGDYVLEVRDEGLNMFAHELGHTLGLLDEYSELATGAESSAAGPPIVFREDVNVWLSPESWPADSSYDPCPDVPWAAEMESCSERLELCCGDSVSGDRQCPLVRAQACGCAGGCECSESNDYEAGHPGLWEGAFYEQEKYYRAREGDLMRKLSQHAEFCEACVRALGSKLCEYRSPHEGCPVPCRSLPDAPIDPPGL